MHCSVSWARADLVGLSQCQTRAHVFSAVTHEIRQRAQGQLSLPEARLALGTALLELDPAWRPVLRWWGILTELFSSLFGGRD